MVRVPIVPSPWQATQLVVLMTFIHSSWLLMFSGMLSSRFGPEKFLSSGIFSIENQ